MALSKSQSALWQRARSVGGGAQAVQLGDGACSYLIARIVRDLGLHARFQDLPERVEPFFSEGRVDRLVLEGHDAAALFERLLGTRQDADTYFACLAALHKARLKYERILSSQPLPTLEQVGPRSLLQYGKAPSDALTSWLFWRKWFFDIDNRAGQETGYLFQTLIAHAIGGASASAGKSPIRRHKNKKLGRQVDCVLGRKAYEFKIRLTIASSGQGRWREELDFALDCKSSGYAPVLVCLDSTPNQKLEQLSREFTKRGGEVFAGKSAWSHLESLAGPTMSVFLEQYVRRPLDDLLTRPPTRPLSLSAEWSEREVAIRIGESVLLIQRQVAASDEEKDETG